MAQGDDVCSSFQLISGKGEFNARGLDDFSQKMKLSQHRVSYAIVSIIGPQSGGKSTLMNNLFGANFKVMDAAGPRTQTTQGIWLAKAADIDPCTLIIDMEGSDSSEKAEDITFEKQSALFALAMSDITLINLWHHDIGREQAGCRALLKTVFQVMMRLYTSRRRTLLFVIRDKDPVTPLVCLEQQLQESIQKIYDSVYKPEANKEAKLSDFFDVQVTSLPNYRTQEMAFKKEVASLRQRFIHSATSGGLAGNPQDKIPASGISTTAQNIWKEIMENKDLNLPVLQIMVAKVRCEEILNEKFRDFIESEDWCLLKEDLRSGPAKKFGKKMTLAIYTSLSKYDKEALFYDEKVQSVRRQILQDKLLQGISNMVRARDPFWEYADDEKTHFVCKFCKKRYAGGASRLKAHLSCIQGRDVSACVSVPDDVRDKAILAINKTGSTPSNKRLKIASSSLPNEGVDVFDSHHQATLSAMYDKKDKANVDRLLAHFFFDNNIAFNVIQTQSFLDFCQALSDFGAGYKVPSYSTLRTKLVANAKNEVDQYVSQMRESWSQSGSGCTLMSDGWTDLKGKSFINMIAYSPKGAVFLMSFEESSERKTGVYLKNLLSIAIEDIGAENVVQVITDNASNYESAGQMLMEVYPHIYKAKCATHGVQLLLKDIDKDIAWIRDTFEEAKDIVDVMTKSPTMKALLRKMTDNRELRKPCKTRFAYNFLMLQSILDVESGLRQLVASPDWRAMKLSTEAIGRKVTDTIQGLVFWKKGHDIIFVLEPLIKVLRLVDGEGSTAGYLYEAMERVREELKERSQNDPAMYLQLWELFDYRRDENILHPVHALAAYLNPLYMTKGRIKYDNVDVKKGMIFVATKILRTLEERRDFSTQITEYNSKSPDIFTFIATHQMETIHPRVWWSQNGGTIPVVQKVAIRILSQPCSASACERNWSAFEAAQTKKRNCLSPDMLEALVSIRMNSKMKTNCANLEKKDTKAINLEELGELPEYEDHIDDGLPDARGEPSTSIASQLVRPAYQTMLDHLYEAALSSFKDSLNNARDNGEPLATAAKRWSDCSMSEFDEGCKDVAIEQATWDDAVHARDKLKDAIKAHINLVQAQDDADAARAQRKADIAQAMANVAVNLLMAAAAAGGTVASAPGN